LSLPQRFSFKIAERLLLCCSKACDYKRSRCH
jgi:hypothetical protein